MKITSHGYVSRTRFFKRKSARYNYTLTKIEIEWKRRLARAPIQPSTRERSTFARRVKRTGNGGRGGEERTEMEFLEDARPLDLSRDDSSPDSLSILKRENYVAHLSVSHIFGRFLCRMGFPSSLFFFFCIFHFSLPISIRKVSEHVHTLPDYLLRIYVEFPLNIL